LTHVFQAIYFKENLVAVQARLSGKFPITGQPVSPPGNSGPGFDGQSQILNAAHKNTTEQEWHGRDTEQE